MTINKIKLKTSIIFLTGSLMMLFSCTSQKAGNPSINEVSDLFNRGELKKAEQLADSLAHIGRLSDQEIKTADSLIEIARRIRIDFSLTEADVIHQLSKYYEMIEPAQLASWEEAKKLEVKLIDSEKRYFKHCVPNLFRLDSAAGKQKIRVDGNITDSLQLFCLSHTEKVIDQTKNMGETVLPVKMKLTYTIKVKPNVVPEGEIIRCWLPFPREGNPRQKEIRLISSLPESVSVAPASDLQRTVYLEQKSVKDSAAIFQLIFEVTTSAQYFDPAKIAPQPYQKETAFYKEFTAERPPHVVFTSQIRQLADRILKGEKEPMQQVAKIYQWINDSIKWASALEYSIIPNIPAYVIENRHGDCGMQTLLFMTLARSQGIPAKWQSGYMLHPGNVSLHDWCEVYYEGLGWLPLDQSFGLQNSDNEKVRNFYITGIDSYRLIVNDDYGKALTPPKKYLRSEPIDFQRGELEWSGGNLYFDQWSWNMDIQYIN